MSSGKQHNRYNTLVLLFLLAIILFVFKIGIAETAIFSISYLVATFLLGPDLDIKSQIYYRWGRYKFLWDFYRMFFKHRSFFSHFPVISDVIRILFLSLLFVPFVLLKELEVILGYVISPFIFIALAAMIFFPKKEKKKLDTLVTEGVVTILLAYSYNNFSLESVGKITELRWELIMGLCGIVLSTTIHTFSDIIYSSNKYIRKKMKLNPKKKKERHA